MSKKLVFPVMLVFLVLGLAFVSCDNGTTSNQTGISWGHWVYDTTQLAVTHEELADGVVKVTVSGIPVSSDDQRWKANVMYTNFDLRYKKGICYRYTVEMWAESGTKDIVIQYYENYDTSTYLNIGLPPITTEHQTFYVDGQPIPSAMCEHMVFQCAGVTGTFYIKILSIEEIAGPGLTIANLSAYEGRSIYAYNHDTIEEVELCAGAAFSWCEDYYYIRFGPISGNTATLKVYKAVYDKNNNYTYLSYTGNDKNVKLNVYLYSQFGNDVVTGTTTVSFTNGIGSGIFIPNH